MKKSLLIAILLFSSLLALAQRTLPYPIIFVHGWVGSDETWYGMGDMLRSQGVNVSLDDVNRRGGEGSRINFHLNADGSRFTSVLNRSSGPSYYGDVYDYNSYINPNNDVFFVNFDNQFPNEITKLSNEAAVVKQGFAVGLAVKKVLNATKAKKVVLVGHSMGGLAIREYLQNSANWLLGDGQHHVAKLVTIGTPHGGSNSTFGNLLTVAGKQESSEAVRDLRHPKNVTFSEIDRGVYLFGGDENNIFRLGIPYFNYDVDCNGSLNQVKGLNQKTLPLDLAYSCVVGLGGKLVAPTATGSTGDDIVEGNRASFFDVQGNAIRYINLTGDTFYADQSKSESSAAQYYSSTDFTWHTKLTKQRFINLYALDEASGTLQYDVDVDKSYIGFFTPRPNYTNNIAFTSRYDSDGYNLDIPQSGLLTIDFSSTSSANGFLELYKDDKSILTVSWATSSRKQILVEAGKYSLAIYGSSGDGSAYWEFNRYQFATSLCPMPTTINLVASGSTSFCEGQSVTLSTTAGYDRYRWYKDNVEISGTGNSIVVNQSGMFTVQGFKCDRWTNSSNNVGVTVKPAPAKPTITKEDQPTQFVLTASSAENYQWLLNGNPINGATAQTYLPQELGNYAVKVAKNDCVSQSDAVGVTMDKPVLVLNGSNPICDGESTTLVAPSGFGQYKWTKDQAETVNDKRELVISKGGTYRVATQRGKFVSAFSDPIAVTVNPKPAKPTISVESSGLKSSSPNNNQWYADGVMVKEATGQTVSNIGAGSYVVRVTELGCYTESEPFVITAISPTAASFALKLYPNPNEGTFWVELPDNLKEWEVVIFDAQGKQVLQQKHSRSLVNREHISLKVSSGTYLLKVIANDQVQQVKLVLE